MGMERSIESFWQVAGIDPPRPMGTPILKSCCEADFDKAISITIDAKTQYPAACNAIETLHNRSSRCGQNNSIFACGKFEN
jgi:hypothetical protein